MLTEKRHEIILQMLQEKRSVTVLEIKEKIGASESTIRRDLNQLHKEGRLTKVFGGAVAADVVYTTKELSVPQKQDVNVEEKRIIARYGASLVEPADFIYLDAGTTTDYMIDYLTQKDITIVTNAVAHARKLAIKGFRVVLLGGELKGTTEAVIGNQAILMLQNYHFSKGFFGTNGISREYGFTTPDISEAMVKKTAIEQCEKSYVLADLSKFGNVSSVNFAPFQKGVVITGEPPERYKIYDNVIGVTK